MGHSINEIHAALETLRNADPSDIEAAFTRRLPADVFGVLVRPHLPEGNLTIFDRRFYVDLANELQETDIENWRAAGLFMRYLDKFSVGG